MAQYETFQELIAWRKGMQLAESIHVLTDRWPSKNLFGLGMQLRHASISVPANIAEGFSGRSRRTYRRHVAIGLGSQAEVQTLLELARRVGLIDDRQVRSLMDLADETGRLLHGLWRSLALKSAVITSCYAVVLAVLGTAAWFVELF